MAVMIDQPADFLLEQRSGDDEPLVCDGFFAQRDNVVVFSTQRVDPEFQAFVRQTHPIWQRGFERAKLLDGTERQSTTTPDDFARYQTLALLEKAAWRRKPSGRQCRMRAADNFSFPLA